MSSAEFSLWLEMYELDLWGELRDYERAGVVASTVANYAGMMRGKGSDPVMPRDFMPRMRGDKEDEVQELDPVAHFNAVAKGKG